jgi:F0F1-type ATP synthase epsilon subunit
MEGRALTARDHAARTVLHDCQAICRITTATARLPPSADTTLAGHGRTRPRRATHHLRHVQARAAAGRYGDESSVTRFAQGEGYVQVTGDHVLILVEDAVEPGDLNTSELQDKLSRAEREASEAEDGSEAERKALRDKARAEAFLSIAEA